MAYTYQYPRPAVTVDALVFSGNPSELKILLIKRLNPPFEGQWAFPGGFLDMDETAEHAALRELKEETNLQGVALKQFRAFSGLNRDPRARTISIVFVGYCANANSQKLRAADDAKELGWFDANNPPPLAFDHQEILAQALKATKERPEWNLFYTDLRSKI